MTGVKKAFKLICEAAASLLICAAIGYILLLLAYLIPADRIEPGVRGSAPVFEQEGSYPYINSICGSNMLDNYTDALMILSAGYPGDEGLIDRATNVYHEAISGLFHTQTLIQLYGHIRFNNNPVYHSPYGRYWHGYLTVLKPLLCFLNYGTIRYLDIFMLITTAGILIFLLYKKQMKQYIIPYLLVLLLLDPFAISNSLQYSWVYFITSIASIILLLKMDRWGNDTGKYVIFFTVTGCITSYFDLLTYPLVTLGIPAVLFLCRSEDNFKENLRLLLCMFMAWGFGYFGMWGLKWIIGSLLTSGNLLSDALSQAAFRVSMTDREGEAISLISVFKDNFTQLMSSPVALIALIYLIILAVTLIVHIRSLLSRSQDQKLYGLLFVLAGLLPIAWYTFMSNHSYVHSFFTYRDLTISVFALLCMLTRYISLSGLKVKKAKSAKDG